MKFSGKNVVITGASSGIGKRAAIDFAKRGASSVVLVSRSESKLADLASHIASSSPSCLAIPIVCDVSQKAQVQRMANDVLQRLGNIDILVNNAGFAIFKKVQDLTVEEMELMSATNFTGMMYCTKAFLGPMLTRRSGHIINIASAAGSFGVAGLAPYCASKFAMLGFSESLYHELYGTGVGITVVSPIGVRTNFFDHESFQGNLPNYTGFMLQPETVSRAIMAAATSPRLEIMVPFYMRATVVLKHILPFVVQPITGAISRKWLR